MLKLGDLVIDVKGSLGGKYWLTEISPVYQYSDNKRTDTVTGYKYIVCLPEKSLEKIAVKIDGKQLLEQPTSSYVEVQFQNLEVFIYWLNQQPQIAAKASNIVLANQKG